jgi:ABC-type branched-subunit amino acid transport system permease subunit
VLGAAFVAVTLFLPQGLVGLWQRLKHRKAA